MPKDKISDYSATANSNTDIGGVNIDEGCAPSGINDAIRTLMKQLKDWQSGSQDVYIHPAGSASVPSITATGDTNTGLFFPAADTVGITTGGTERLRLDSSGNLGLGVTPSASWAASANLQIGPGAVYNNSSLGAYDVSYNSIRTGSNTYVYAQSSLQATRFQQRDGAFNFFTAASGTAGNAISFTQAMTLDASGNLALGNTSPQARFHSTAGATSQAGIFEAANSVALLSFVSNTTSSYTRVQLGAAGNDMVFYTTSSERARIDSSGNFLVGTTTQQNNGLITGKQTVNTSSVFSAWNATTTGDAQFVWFGTEAGGTTRGSITYNRTGGLTAYNTTSDYRAKTVKGPVQNALAKVAALKPSTGRMNDAEQDIDFFVAHELQNVVPSAVTGEKDAVNEDGSPKYQMVDKSALIPLLAAAIQELNVKFEAYKAAHP